KKARRCSPLRKNIIPFFSWEPKSTPVTITTGWQRLSSPEHWEKFIPSGYGKPEEQMEWVFRRIRNHLPTWTGICGWDLRHIHPIHRSNATEHTEVFSISPEGYLLIFGVI